MENLLAKMIREIVNLPNDVQVELFCTISKFPSITFLILEMTFNHLARFFESSRGVPLFKPHTLKQPTGGKTSDTRNPMFERLTQAIKNRTIARIDSIDDRNGNDEEVERETSKEECPMEKVSTCSIQL